MTDQRYVREAVAVMDDVPALEMAVSALREAGFADEDISLLASADTVAAKLGKHYRRVEELEDDPAAPRTGFVSTRTVNKREDWVIGSLTTLPTLAAAATVVASAGAVAAAITATAVAGAFIGTGFAQWMDRRHAEWLEHQIEHGGILLWVRTPDAEAERRALSILKAHAAHDVHIHRIPIG
ncbi:MAG: hypothetical protein KDE35_12135 [Geminicoccaceae bacterium]|nr:hypothetical protein [Geminicoccaceae bacterium]